MILILANEGDAGAAALAADLAPAPALVGTCIDLAGSPSSLRDPRFGASSVTVGGERVVVSTIEAVVNVVPAVTPGALVMYDPEERPYQAAEMNAWLMFFLSAVTCPVVNRPSRLSLAGPVLNPLGWFHLARAAGIPVADTAASSAAVDVVRRAEAPGPLGVTWVSGMPARTTTAKYTASLAHRAGVRHLHAWYEHDGAGRPRFAGARCVPDLASASVRRHLAAALVA